MPANPAFLLFWALAVDSAGLARTRLDGPMLAKNVGGFSSAVEAYVSSGPARARPSEGELSATNVWSRRTSSSYLEVTSNLPRGTMLGP